MLQTSIYILMPHTPALRKANWVNYKIYQNAAQLGSSAEETTLKEVYNLKEEKTTGRV